MLALDAFEGRDLGLDFDLEADLEVVLGIGGGEANGSSSSRWEEGILSPISSSSSSSSPLPLSNISKSESSPFPLSPDEEPSNSRLVSGLKEGRAANLLMLLVDVRLSLSFADLGFVDLDLDFEVAVEGVVLEIEVAPLGLPRGLDAEFEVLPVDVRGRGGLKGLGAIVCVVRESGLRQRNRQWQRMEVEVSLEVSRREVWEGASTREVNIDFTSITVSHRSK